MLQPVAMPQPTLWQPLNPKKRWGTSCQCCTQSTPHPEQADSDWPEEDWDGEIQKAKQKEKQRKEEEEIKQTLAAEEHRATTA